MTGLTSITNSRSATRDRRVSAATRTAHRTATSPRPNFVASSRPPSTLRQRTSPKYSRGWDRFVPCSARRPNIRPQVSSRVTVFEVSAQVSAPVSNKVSDPVGTQVRAQVSPQVSVQVNCNAFVPSEPRQRSAIRATPALSAAVKPLDGVRSVPILAHRLPPPASAMHLLSCASCGVCVVTF